MRLKDVRGFAGSRYRLNQLYDKLAVYYSLGPPLPAVRL